MKEPHARRFRSLGDQDGRAVQRTLREINATAHDQDAQAAPAQGTQPGAQAPRPAPLRPLTDDVGRKLQSKKKPD